MLKVVHEENETNAHVPAAVGGSLLDELARDGARAMLAAALRAEVAAYVDTHAGQVDETGHRLVVRNGYHAEREVSTAAGAVLVRAPRVNDRRIDEDSGERMRFASAILPAWARKSPQVAEVLPLLYLHGLSSGDFCPALEQFLGSAAGLSPATITRLTGQWQDDAEASASGRWPTPTTSEQGSCSTTAAAGCLPAAPMTSSAAIADQAGIDDDFTSHALRHTFGTTLVRDGHDLVLVAELMGHARLDQTRRYSLPTQADRERAINSLPTDR